MNNIKQILSLVVILLLSVIVQAQDCSIVQDGGTFINDQSRALVIIIEGNSRTETYVDGYIKSTVTWTGDCTYTLTIDEFTIPDYVFSVGDVVSVVIDSVVGDKIVYTSTKGATTWVSEMLKE